MDTATRLPDGEQGCLGDAMISENALAALRLEHADFHFAQDLAKGVVDGDAPPRKRIRPPDRPTSTAAAQRKKARLAAQNAQAQL